MYPYVNDMEQAALQFEAIGISGIFPRKFAGCSATA
jgi:hypothetical protein